MTSGWINKYGVVAVLLAAMLGASPASGETAAEFFSGKTLKLVVGAGAGGGYDLYARVLARHIGKHIPGEPTVIVENMPGGAGNVATNYVYNIAPKIGTVMSMPFYDQPLRQLVRPQGIRYDMGKVGWLGNMAQLTTVIAVYHTAPVKTLEDVKNVEVIMGSDNPGSETYSTPSVANVLLGTKFRLVTGYPSTAAITAAMQGGEVMGRGGSWISWKVLNPQLVREKKIRLLAQAGLRKDPDLPDVPMLNEFARSDEDRAVLRLVLALPIGMSRTVFTPPGVPHDRFQALRNAFAATMADPALLEDAKKRDMDISTSTGQEVEKLVGEIMAASPEQIKRARAILGYK